jgi:hypothetical protein
MKRLLSILACAALAASLSVSAFARGGGASGGGSGPAAGSHALENSNGRFAEDRDKGQERAEDRRSAQGASHEKAGDAKKKHRRQPPAEPGAAK